MRKNRSKPSCKLGSYTISDARPDPELGVNVVDVSTNFEVTDELARFLRRNGRFLEGVEAGCAHEYENGFEVLLDTGTDASIVYVLMKTLNDWTGTVPFTTPVVAPCSRLRDERKYEDFVESLGKP